MGDMTLYSEKYGIFFPFSLQFDPLSLLKQHVKIDEDLQNKIQAKVKNSRSQISTKSRIHEVKNSRGQEFKKSRGSQEINNSRIQEVNKSTGRELKKSPR